jgi:UDP-GlcNAc:undecaprenyl-phosphate/decaprenyl-phosphate GlcNAc-1-phosphate transferase
MKISMYNLIFAFITALVITAMAVPSIIKIAHQKQLFDEPDERKLHNNQIPSLGGLAIFAGLIFSLTFWSNQAQILELQYIISAIIILFFIGIKDDMVALVAYKKLIGQLLSAIIIVHWAGIRLNTFYGLFGIWDLELIPSYILSIFTIIVITNSFNLIDGIDGLAASIGIICASVFGVWFSLMGSNQFAILSFSLVGALFGFLWFNKQPAKIFMGDTGSLISGFVLALLAIKFIEMNRVMDRYAQYKVLSVPVVTIGILIIPLFDTIRVFSIRLLNKRSPFSPDRNHIHHILLDLGLNHRKAVYSLCGFNLLIILMVWGFQGWMRGEILLLLVILIPLTAVTYLGSLKRQSIRKIS